MILHDRKGAHVLNDLHVPYVKDEIKKFSQKCRLEERSNTLAIDLTSDAETLAD